MALWLQCSLSHLKGDLHTALWLFGLCVFYFSFAALFLFASLPFLLCRNISLHHVNYPVISQIDKSVAYIITHYWRLVASCPPKQIKIEKLNFIDKAKQTRSLYKGFQGRWVQKWHFFVWRPLLHFVLSWILAEVSSNWQIAGWINWNICSWLSPAQNGIPFNKTMVAQRFGSRVDFRNSLLSTDYVFGLGVYSMVQRLYIFWRQWWPPYPYPCCGSSWYQWHKILFWSL